MEVLGDVGLGPDFTDAVFLEHDFLQGGPPEEGIVADERTHRPASATERNRKLDTSSELRDTVLEKVVSDLHDTRRMLENGDLGACLKFTDGVDKAIVGYSGIRVDEENDRTTVMHMSDTECDSLSGYVHSNVAISPSTTLRFSHSLT